MQGKRTHINANKRKKTHICFEIKLREIGVLSNQSLQDIVPDTSCQKHNPCDQVQRNLLIGRSVDIENAPYQTADRQRDDAKVPEPGRTFCRKRQSGEGERQTGESAADEGNQECPCHVGGSNIMTEMFIYDAKQEAESGKDQIQITGFY